MNKQAQLIAKPLSPFGKFLFDLSGYDLSINGYPLDKWEAFERYYTTATSSEIKENATSLLCTENKAYHIFMKKP